MEVDDGMEKQGVAPSGREARALCFRAVRSWPVPEFGGSMQFDDRETLDALLKELFCSFDCDNSGEGITLHGADDRQLRCKTSPPRDRDNIGERMFMSTATAVASEAALRLGLAALRVNAVCRQFRGEVAANGF